MSPKITVHGGATNAHGADVSPAADVSQPLVGAEADLGRPTPTEPDEAVVEVAAEAPAADAVPLPEAKDYSSMTLAELREEADSRNVASYGSKAQITERLQAADSEE